MGDGGGSGVTGLTARTEIFTAQEELSQHGQQGLGRVEVVRRRTKIDGCDVTAGSLAFFRLLSRGWATGLPLFGATSLRGVGAGFAFRLCAVW